MVSFILVQSQQAFICSHCGTTRIYKHFYKLCSQVHIDTWVKKDNINLFFAQGLLNHFRLTKFLRSQPEISHSSNKTGQAGVEPEHRRTVFTHRGRLKNSKDIRSFAGNPKKKSQVTVTLRHPSKCKKINTRYNQE